jgi:PAS domain S-box-containing protein
LRRKRLSRSRIRGFIAISRIANERSGAWSTPTFLGVFIGNVEGAIAEANDAFLQMLQYGRQDLVSGRLRWTDLTPAESRERDEGALTEVMATGVVQPYEKEFLRKDGSRVPVLIGAALFQEGGKEGVVFVLDLSEQKRAQERIRGRKWNSDRFWTWRLNLLWYTGLTVNAFTPTASCSITSV